MGTTSFFCFIAAIAVFRAGFGAASNTVQIKLDNIHCIGNEGRLLDCQHSPIGVHNCGHEEDAAVICQDSMTTAGKSAYNTVNFNHSDW